MQWVVALTCQSRTWEAEARGLGVQSYLQLHREFEVSQAYMRPCLKTNKYPKENLKDSMGSWVLAVPMGPFVESDLSFSPGVLSCLSLPASPSIYPSPSQYLFLFFHSLLHPLLLAPLLPLLNFSASHGLVFSDSSSLPFPFPCEFRVPRLRCMACAGAAL